MNIYEHMRVGDYWLDSQECSISIWKLCSSWGIGIEVVDGASGKVKYSAIIPLEKLMDFSLGAISGLERREQPGATDSFKALADYLANAFELKKNNGVWTPQVDKGDTVIVDKPGASEVKAFDVAEQSFERIPKKKIRVVGPKCTCPIRDIMIGGCTCGAFEAEMEAKRDR